MNTGPVLFCPVLIVSVGSRPVESDDEADVIVSSSSSANSYGAAGSRTDDITSLSAAHNPLISAFMNWGAASAALPCGQEGWGVQDTMTHNTHTYNTLTTRDYGRSDDQGHFNLKSVLNQIISNEL